MAQLESIARFFKEQDIPFITPGSPNYTSLREAYISDSPIVPLGIVRPRSAKDVAAVVGFAVAHGVEFSIRTGGHDLFGRSYVQGGLCIDMRDIAYVHVDGSSTARIGGGTLALEVAQTLSEHELGTAIGSYPSVGFVGWATHGGYGPFAPNYGLGVDQIVAAQLVNWQGKIVEADEDILMALRGGGGAVGVIVELTIKTYSLKQILGGIITFKSDDIRHTIKGFLAHLNGMRDHGLPPPLGIQQSVVNTPSGKVFAVGFMWSSDDLNAGREYLSRILDFGTPLHNSVTATGLAEWLEMSGKLPPPTAYGAICTVRVRKETDEVAETLAAMADKMPDDPAVLFSVHEVRGPSARPQPNSVFAARESHFLIECIGTSSLLERSAVNWRWALDLQDAIQQTASENVLLGSYLPLTPPGKVVCSEIYGPHWENLQRIKYKYDPKNVFKNALVKFD